MSLIYSVNYENFNQELINFSNILKQYISDNTIFVCIGSDKIIFDSIGPLTGDKLKCANLTVYGDLENPINATNYQTQYNYITNKHPDAKFLIIDTALTTNPNLVNNINFYDEPINPGAFKKFNKFGDYKIIGIIDLINNPDPLHKNIRLYDVNNFANFISQGIIQATKL